MASLCKLFSIASDVDVDTLVPKARRDFDKFIVELGASITMDNHLHKSIPRVESENLETFFKWAKLVTDNLPKMIIARGTKRWYLNGKLHREDGPAVERIGVKEWWVNGKRHREDGPATEWISGSKSWWVNGKRHREAGLPAVEEIAAAYITGTKMWYVNGKLHREGGPAIERSDGTKEWWINGVFLKL